MKQFIIIVLVFFLSANVYSQNSVKRPDTYNYNRGLEELRNENYSEALNFFNKEIEADKQNGYAYSWIAMIRHSQEEYGRALTAVNMALKYVPKRDVDFLSATYNVRAGIYLALEDTIKALNDYASSIKTNPSEENTYEKRAQIYYEQDKYDLADADYRQIIKLNPGGVMGFMGIGRNCNAQKRWQEAIEQFNHVANLYSDYSSVYSFRAESYIGQEKWPEATDDIIKALALDGDNKAFSLMQELKGSAFELLKTKMKIQSTKNPNNAYWPYCIGVMHEHNEEYEKAIPFYMEAQRIDANDFTLRRISQCYYQLGDYQNALTNIQQAIDLDSTKVQYIPFKADILYEMGNSKAAIAEWDKHQILYPEYGFGYYRRGWFKSLSGDEEGAIDDYNMCIALEPDASYAFASRGDAYSRLGKSEAAKADFLKVIEIEYNPEKYEFIHYAYQGLGDNEKAIEAIDTIIARNEDKKGNYYDAACMYSRMKNKEKALEYLEKSLESGYNRFAHIGIDHDMDFIRESVAFKNLIKKYEDLHKSKLTKSTSSQTSNELITTEIPFTKENGICNVKCKINDLPLYFVFDTGASTVSLSMVEATFMMKNGYLNKKDVIGSQYFMDANGNINEGTVINIKKVDFGGLELENIRASVVRNQKAPLLLGQSVLNKLGKIEIDNVAKVLKVTYKK